MPSPTSSLATLRPDLGGSLEEFDLAADRMGFIATDVFPVFDTIKKSGTFGRIPLKQLLKKRTSLRSPGSGYNRGNFTFEPVTFACQEHGLEEPVDDTEAEMYREFFDAEQVAGARALDGVLRNAEQRVADAVFNTTTWTGAGLTTVITQEWDDEANAVPIADVAAAVKKVWEGSGLWPNALIINRRVFNSLVNVVSIIDRVKYQGNMDARAGTITAAALAQALNIERLIISGSPKNTANEGQAASIAAVWSDEYAMVARVATTNDIREPCIGRSLHWSADGSQVGGTVESYREEAVRSDIIRVRHDLDEKMLYPQAGHLLSNVTT